MCQVRSFLNRGSVGFAPACGESQALGRPRTGRTAAPRGQRSRRGRMRALLTRGLRTLFAAIIVYAPSQLGLHGVHDRGGRG